jgi:hypothetical protein
MKWPWVSREARVDEILARYPKGMSRDEILEALAVAEDDRMLAAVIHVVMGWEEIAKSECAQAQVPHKANFSAGRLAMAMDIGTSIVEYARRGRERKEGK